MSEECRQKCTHVIFDVDGLLLDTESIYTKIFCSFLKEYGKEFTMEFKVKLMGKPELVSLQAVLEEYQLTNILTVQQAQAILKERKLELFPHAQLLPGAEKLINHFFKNNIPMALATGSATYEFNLKMANHDNVLKMMSHVVKSDDPAVKQGKPNPDIFQVAASRFESPPDPSNVLVFEDAPHGVKAAVAAGMNVVMVPEHYVDTSKCTEASQIISSLEVFKPSIWGLPSFS